MTQFLVICNLIDFTQVQAVRTALRSNPWWMLASLFFQWYTMIYHHGGDPPVDKDDRMSPLHVWCSPRQETRMSQCITSVDHHRKTPSRGWQSTRIKWTFPTQRDQLCWQLCCIRSPSVGARVHWGERKKVGLWRPRLLELCDVAAHKNLTLPYILVTMPQFCCCNNNTNKIIKFQSRHNGRNFRGAGGRLHQ